MPLTYHPAAGAIVICDFSVGFRPPEIVKKRPVVVISPRRRQSQLFTVIPLSSTAPITLMPWHYPIKPGAYPPARGPMWAKADIIMTVALDRLDRVMMRDEKGKRTYLNLTLNGADLADLHRAVVAALAIVSP